MPNPDAAPAESPTVPGLPDADTATLSRRGVLILGLLSALLLSLAFPPFDWTWLAWVAPLGWLWLVSVERLPRRAYWLIYLSGLLFWLIVLYGVGHAHWATRLLGWPALCAYLAIYLPLFVGFTRWIVHPLHIPLPLAAPVVWTGLEFVRAHFATGLAIAQLGHTQVEQLPLIQISDITGAYGVSFLVMLVAACLVELRLLPVAPSRKEPRKSPWWLRTAWAVLAMAAVGGTWLYGTERLSETESAIAKKAGGEKLRVGMVQGSIDTVFGDPTQSRRTFEQYLELTDQLVKKEPNLDLIVWPETTMGEHMLIEVGDDFAVPEEVSLDPQEYRRRVESYGEQFHELLSYLAHDRWNTPLLLGTSALRYGNQRMDHYNAAVYVERTGRLASRYDKMHPVMFGEYAPLGDWFPMIYDWLPIGSGLTPGVRPIAIEVEGIALVPCICFENTVPHLISQQLREVQSAGTQADALITLTNDGWFWGSSILDLHRTCAVFRAVENRRPMLVVANTGISAEIDLAGHIRQQAPVRENALLVAEVPQRPLLMMSWYTQHGDWFAAGCFLASLALGGYGWWLSRRPRVS